MQFRLRLPEAHDKLHPSLGRYGISIRRIAQFHPLRYPWWLAKAINNLMTDPAALTASNAHLQLGVTKTAARSIRQWTLATGAAQEQADRTLIHSAIFEALFLVGGWDPYFEDPASIWLAHWGLASRRRQTRWYWLFNHLPTPEFTVDSATEQLVELAREHAWARATPASLRREVRTWLHSYYAGEPAGRSAEDTLDRPFAELDLIRATLREGVYMLRREPRASLPPEVFGLAEREFMRRRDAACVTLEELLVEPGAPGRVFGLDEDGLARQVEALCARIKPFNSDDRAGRLRLRLVEDFEPIDLLARMYAARSGPRSCA